METVDDGQIGGRVVVWFKGRDGLYLEFLRR